MAETQTINWDEVYVDESITEEAQAASENISVETPVGKFLFTIVECTAKENAMSAYTCHAANLKMRIDDVIEIEQPVKDTEGKVVKRNGETLYKKMPVEPGKKAGINDLYAGRFIFDQINLVHSKEKEAMKNRRLYIAKKIGIIDAKTDRLTGRDWANAVGKRGIVSTAWNSWTDKVTGEIKKNVKVEWAGYDSAPVNGSVNNTPQDEDFSDI